MGRTRASSLLGLLLLLAGPAAAANIQTVTMEGTVLVGASSNTALGGYFQNGVDRLRITFSYDADTPEVGGPGGCCGAFSNPIVSAQATVLRAGAPIYSASWVASGPGGQMNAQQRTTFDRILILSGQGNMGAPTVNGLGLAEAQADLYFPVGHLPSADSLPPASVFDVHSVTSGGIGLTFGPGGASAAIGVQSIDTMLVPEPGVAPLLALGTLGLGLGRRRERRGDPAR